MNTIYYYIQQVKEDSQSTHITICPKEIWDKTKCTTCNYSDFTGREGDFLDFLHLMSFNALFEIKDNILYVLSKDAWKIPAVLNQVGLHYNMDFKPCIMEKSKKHTKKSNTNTKGKMKTC